MRKDQAQTPLIQVKDVNKYYGMGDSSLHVLKDVNLEIYEGEFVSIMGPSGSGKSTLINILGFLDNDFEGEYTFKGEALEQRTDAQVSHLRNEKVGFVFQSFNLIDSMTVAENVRLPLLYGGMTSRQTRERVQEALDQVGIGDKGGHYPHELSGGQKQRVAIARALINRPRFIIADEPTGALDTKTSHVIMQILSRMHKEREVTIVMVTHDPIMQQFANRHVVIIDGQVAEAESEEAERLTEEFNKTYEDLEVTADEV